MATQSSSFKKHLLNWLNPILLTLCSALLLTLSFPNFDGFYLAFIALVPLFIVIERKSFFQALFCLVLFIVLFYGYFMSWVDVFHPFALPGIIVYLSIIHIVPFAIYRALRGRYHHIYDPFLLAALFTLLEYARGLGFPRFQYGILAYSQYTFLPFIQISDVTGFLGVSFLLYLTNSFIAHLLSQIELLELKAKKYFRTFAGGFSYILFNRVWIIIILLSLNLVYGFIRLRQVPEPALPPQQPFKATLIQPWFDYNLTENRFSILTQKLFHLTKTSITTPATTSSPQPNSDNLANTLAPKSSTPSPEPNSSQTPENTTTSQNTAIPPSKPIDDPQSSPNTADSNPKSIPIQPLLPALDLPDLIIWPESAIDVYYKYELDNFVLPKKQPTAAYSQAMYDFFRALGAEYQTTFLAGSFSLDPITKIVPVTPPTPPNQSPDQPPNSSSSQNPNQSSDQSPSENSDQSSAQSPHQPDPNNNNTPNNDNFDRNNNRNTTTSPEEISQLKNPELETITIGYRKYNSALLIDKNGLVTDWSGKIHLVPFAEHFPFTNILEKFPFIHQILKKAQASQFNPYDQRKIFFHRNVPFSVLICYDDTFSDLSRTFTIAGAQFLIIITNDAWSYSERSQNIHYAFSFFRAIENRRPILRVGNAGVTGMIDPQGRTHNILPMFEEGFSTVTFYPQSNLTFYTSFGDWFIFLLIFLIILIAAPFTISRYFLKYFQRIKRPFHKKPTP